MSGGAVRRRTRLVRRSDGNRGLGWLAVAGVAVLLALAAPPASAHAGLESTDPPDGAVVIGEVGRIVVRFTGEVEPVGEGFVALDADAGTRSPTSITSTDGRT